LLLATDNRMTLLQSKTRDPFFTQRDGTKTNI
jgi:hypothetical protein